MRLLLFVDLLVHLFDLFLPVAFIPKLVIGNY